MRNRLAWGIQASEGTAMSTNASLYEVSFTDGKGVANQDDEKGFETSDANDVVEDFYHAKAWWTGDPTLEVDVDSIGSLYKAHLGTDTPSGAGPYTHVITKGTPGWVSMYEMNPGPVGGTDYWVQGIDGFIKGIETSFTAGEPLTAKLDVEGKTPVFNFTAPVPGRDMRIATTAPTGSIATMIGATLNIDLATTPSTTQVRNIEKGTVMSSYSGSLIQTDAYTPTFRSIGKFTLGINVTAILTNVEYQAFTNTFYNTTTIAANMALSANPTTPPSGSAVLTFNSIGATASRSVAFAAPAMRWRVTLPSVQPSGDAVRVEMTGLTKYNANPLTVTAINNRPTY